MNFTKNVAKKVLTRLITFNFPKGLDKWLDFNNFPKGLDKWLDFNDRSTSLDLGYDVSKVSTVPEALNPTAYGTTIAIIETAKAIEEALFDALPSDPRVADVRDIVGEISASYENGVPSSQVRDEHVKKLRIGIEAIYGTVPTVPEVSNPTAYNANIIDAITKIERMVYEVVPVEFVDDVTKTLGKVKASYENSVPSDQDEVEHIANVGKCIDYSAIRASIDDSVLEHFDRIEAASKVSDEVASGNDPAANYTADTTNE